MTDHADNCFEADKPIVDTARDSFNRSHFAERVAETIKRRTDSSSLVIGIYGPWGEGKTSVLNLIQNSLRADSALLTILFNPWRVDGENALLQSFFGKLAASLDVTLASNKEAMGALMRQYGGLVTLIPHLGTVAKDVIGKFDPASVEDLYSRISSVLADSGKKIVIFIDDIDRLDKSEIQGLFRLIKLTADFPNTIYVLAFDQEMVSAALGERFVSNVALHGSAGASYLEKIVQVPLHLPPTTFDNRLHHCYERIDRVLQDCGITLTEIQSTEFISNFQTGIAIRLKTPRMAVRYTNTLAFALGTLKGETNAVDVMLLEGLRVFYTPLYDYVRSNPDEFLQGNSGNDRSSSRDTTPLIKDRMPYLADKEVQAAAALLRKLFPRFTNTTLGNDWEAQWIVEQRVCSSLYFMRYFTYGVGDEDVPDSSIQVLLSTGKEDLLLCLAGFLTQANAKTFIQKMRSNETKLSPQFAAILAPSLARCGGLLSKGGGLFGQTSPWSQAGMLLSRLVMLQAADNRASLSVQIINNAKPPLFALEFHRWLTAAKDVANQTVPPDQQQGINAALCVLIAAHLASLEEPVFTREPDDAGRYLSTWLRCGGSEDVYLYLTTMINKFPETVLDLLRAFMGQAWSGSQRIQPEFNRDNYNSLIQFISPKMVANNLLRSFSELKLIVNTYPYDEDDLDMRLARQFMFVHSVALKEQSDAVIQTASDTDQPL